MTTATVNTTAIDSSSFSTAHHVDRGGLLSLPVSLDLLEAASRADKEGVLLALENGADINACDLKGRTVVGYVIGGERYG